MDKVASADILLIQSPPWDTEMPPLGTAYLSSYLKKFGRNVSLLDLNIALYQMAGEDSKYLWEQKNYDCWVDTNLFKDTWCKLQDNVLSCFTKALKESGAKRIGLSVNYASINFAGEFLKLVTGLHKDLKIIVGGWGCSTSHMRSLFPAGSVDVFVVGEGEETLFEVMEVLDGERPEAEVAGAVFSKNPAIEYRPRPPIKDLDSIPWPTFEEFQLNQYKHRVLPVFTSRGCIGHCSFCNDWYISKPYRHRSAGHIFEELKYQKERYKIQTFSFKDLLCNGDIDELSRLADLIIESGLGINWDSQAIPRKEMTYDLLCKLKECGCGTLIYGIETFSDNVLKRMRKLFTSEIAERVIRDTHKAGIPVMFNIIVGFPGETEEDFQKTYDAIKRNRQYIDRIGAVSVCLVNAESDLEVVSQNYGLVLSPDHRIRAKQWHTEDNTNTYSIRKKRAERIYELISQLGLSYATLTI
ncbi:MAG: radical SAM protein [Candidatus Omnitrophota bacterium]